jgi:hypothetical protein
VPELAVRNAENLRQKVREVNEEKRLVRWCPSEAQVIEWIDHAREMPRVIED